MEDKVLFSFATLEPHSKLSSSAEEYVCPITLYRNALTKNCLFFHRCPAFEYKRDSPARERRSSPSSCSSILFIRVSYPYPKVLRCLLSILQREDDQSDFLTLQRQCKENLSKRFVKNAGESGIQWEQKEKTNQGFCAQPSRMNLLGNMSRAATSPATLSPPDSSIMTLLALFCCSKSLNLSWNAELAARTLVPQFLSKEMIFPSLSVCFFFLQEPARNGVSPICPGVKYLAFHCFAYFRSHREELAPYASTKQWGRLCEACQQLHELISMSEKENHKQLVERVCRAAKEGCQGTDEEPWGGINCESKKPILTLPFLQYSHFTLERKIVESTPAVPPSKENFITNSSGSLGQSAAIATPKKSPARVRFLEKESGKRGLVFPSEIENGDFAAEKQGLPLSRGNRADPNSDSLCPASQHAAEDAAALLSQEEVLKEIAVQRERIGKLQEALEHQRMSHQKALQEVYQRHAQETQKMVLAAQIKAAQYEKAKKLAAALEASILHRRSTEENNCAQHIAEENASRRCAEAAEATDFELQELLDFLPLRHELKEGSAPSISWLRDCFTDFIAAQKEDILKIEEEMDYVIQQQEKTRQTLAQLQDSMRRNFGLECYP